MTTDKILETIDNIPRQEWPLIWCELNANNTPQAFTDREVSFEHLSTERTKELFMAALTHISSEVGKTIILFFWNNDYKEMCSKRMYEAKRRKIMRHLLK